MNCFACPGMGKSNIATIYQNHPVVPMGALCNQVIYTLETGDSWGGASFPTLYRNFIKINCSCATCQTNDQTKHGCYQKHYFSASQSIIIFLLLEKKIANKFKC